MRFPVTVKTRTSLEISKGSNTLSFDIVILALIFCSYTGTTEFTKLKTGASTVILANRSHAVLSFHHHFQSSLQSNQAQSDSSELILVTMHGIVNTQSIEITSCYNAGMSCLFLIRSSGCSNIGYQIFCLFTSRFTSEKP